MGKFPNDTVEALYVWSLHGFCDSSGNVEAPTGWYCRLDVDQGVYRQLIADLDGLNVEVHEIVGYWLLYEDQQGFVDAEQFPDAPKRDRVWDRLEREYGKWFADD